MSETLNGDSSETLRARQQTLQELTEFTENCQTQLKELFDSLGWDQEWNENISKESMKSCPYDPNHRVPDRSMERHKVKCLLNQMGYSKDEQAEMFDPSGCYERASIPSVIMDKNLQQQVIQQARAKAPLIKMEGQYSQGDYSKDANDVPQNYKRATCDLTVADRLALYDHVTQETLRAKTEAANNEDLYVDLVAKLKKDDGQSGPKSHLEVLAEMRDYKRRRQSYRAKNVHITKKSYTEVIREVIDVHSGELANMWQEDEQEPEMEEAKTSKHSSHRRQSEDQRSASVESRQSHVSSREDHSSKDGHSHGHSHSSRHKRKRSRERSREEDDTGRVKRDSHSPEVKRHHKKKKKKKKKE
ncbi:U11/U12 small nuclear ribonucleoprotein 48 kDa protein [Clupea harengus]|uniref:U11/U12 small nuclear ribonucleoprotein 48 kDa protein n=1 Tax=Clupea harengus TaxID=7950 RepID=A0A6P3VYX6_CLUHA|nr:U11/U12 small nuclear ribonucleoprotein 48 kDa protein [Clupea harengus]